MIVCGKLVGSNVIYDCTKAMRESAVFAMSDVRGIAIGHGYDMQTSDRIADRLIQKNKKAGKVSYIGRGIWRWNE